MKEEARFDCIITSGQIGSFIAFDSFLTDFEKENLKKIIIDAGSTYDSQIKDNNNNLQISNLIKNNKYYNQNIKFIECKINKETLKKHSEKHKIVYTRQFKKNYHNYSWHLYEKINIKNSSFIKIKNADLEKFNLPEKYCVVVGWSKRKEKKFTTKDWKELIKILESKKIKAFVINNFYRDDVKIPKHELLIDMTEKTSLLESIEITKNANLYIGINGCLSIIAMQKYPRKCMIKSCIEKFKWFRYFYPKVKNIEKIFFKEITSNAKTILLRKDSIF